MVGSELVIRASRSGSTCELIPTHALQGDFPQAFVDEYTHWRDLQSGVIEWRPSTDPWNSSAANWRMQPDGQGGQILVRGKSTLIDIASPTAEAVNSVLGSLESIKHMHIFFNEQDGTVEVQLPRMKLDFFLRNKGQDLESKQFREMVVDRNQSIGTFTGLTTKLVLHRPGHRSRSVIVPHGTVHFSQRDHHVCVVVDSSGHKSVPYHYFQVDTLLGRLVDNGSLISKLFKSYLHATTAHCLPDTLTGKTGTEQALAVLREASTRSIHGYGKAEFEILRHIAQLTPQRRYYPKHLRVMHEEEWTSLSPLSHHNAFFKLASLLWLSACDHHSLFGEPQLDVDLGVTDEHLLERASIRDSSFRVADFGADDFTHEHDAIHNSRDYVPQGYRESQARWISSLVDVWSANLKPEGQLLSVLESWNRPLRGPDLQSSDLAQLGYSSRLLDPLEKFLPDEWCTLAQVLTCCRANEDKYRVMFFLSTLAFSRFSQQELIETLLAFATVPSMRALRPPQMTPFDLSRGYVPTRSRLLSIMEDHSYSYYSCPEEHLPPRPYETSYDTERRRWDEHKATREKKMDLFMDSIMHQWPAMEFQPPEITDCHKYISLCDALKDVREWYQHWRRNSEFKAYIQDVQNVLDGLHRATQPSDSRHHFDKPQCSYSPKRAFVSFTSVFRKPAPLTHAPPSLDLEHVVFPKEQDESNDNSLEMLLEHIGSRCSKGYEQRYVNDLLRSLRCLRQRKDADFIPERREGTTLLLDAYLDLCRKNLDDVFHSIRANLGADCSTTDHIMMRAGLWPRLSPTSLLCHLVPGEHAILTNGWKYALVQYALALTTLQRAERLVACINDPLSLTRELRTSGHEGWDPMQYPEWLVLEVESNILIREQQARIALEMMSPSSGTNSIMQLNMGEGKSSVIVPMVAAALADGAKLARVIVLRPLQKQMFDVLLSRVGGLLNRRIFQFPISRSLRFDGSRAGQLRELCRQCMKARGILLVQPEHLLSFELMGLEQLISGNEGLGMHMVETQLWLENHSRDILDESDEILNVNFELIYTMGIQRPIDMSPDRWNIVQRLLGLVFRFVNPVLEEYPGGLEVKGARPGSPSCVRILQTQAGRALLMKVAAEVCTSGLPGVPLHFFPSDVRDAMLRFITNRDIAEADMDLLRRRAWGEQSTRRNLLLLRGLISGGVLTFALEQKRWRVNYGHDLSRTMLAVPYRAKDTPAPRAEFSHPDATIALTCLAYYASGLSDGQLRTAFERLFLCDHAQEEYELWVRDTTGLPPSLHRLTGVNLKDPMQWSKQLFPSLRRSKATIDFYMSQVVFPEYMKEFPDKISASGWNLARSKVHLTTGFSGTNDSRYVLPLDARQCELPEQMHTNALQLSHVLRPENSFQPLPRNCSRFLDADTLLRMVVASKPPVRVILDVGAQVLELRNEQVASAWLALVPEPEAQAVIFFNDYDELSVLSRDGAVEMLKASPFSQQMDQCLVYLDEAHTRGTDLQLPTDYRAAVTLGPGLTKDRLVQGAFLTTLTTPPMLTQRQPVCGCGNLERANLSFSALRWR